jgi:hypothetical protein
VAGSAFGGLLIVDGLAHLRSKDQQSSEQDTNQEPRTKVSFARVVEIALGVTALAASILLKDKTASSVFGRVK